MRELIGRHLQLQGEAVADYRVEVAERLPFRRDGLPPPEG